MSCQHQLPSTWFSRGEVTAGEPFTQVRVDWCPECGATREQLEHYKPGDRGLEGADFLEHVDEADWRAPRSPQVPELVCQHAPDGKHLWRDTGETLRCVTYQCELCDKRDQGAPGVPDQPHVPARIPIDASGTVVYESDGHAVRCMLHAASALQAYGCERGQILGAVETALNGERVVFARGLKGSVMELPSMKEPMHDSEGPRLCSICEAALGPNGECDCGAPY